MKSLTEIANIRESFKNTFKETEQWLVRHFDQTEKKLSDQFEQLQKGLPKPIDVEVSEPFHIVNENVSKIAESFLAYTTRKQNVPQKAKVIMLAAH
jgi:hypothetical protein